MTPLTIAITVLAYFLLLFTVSWLAGRKTDSKGFFGSRKSPWYIVSIATMGSFISGVTFVSVPGMVDEKGFSYLQMVMGFVVGQMIIAFVLVPLFYKMNLVSVYQYLEDRFGVKSYKTGAWFFFISKMLGASVRLFLVCLTLQLLVFEPMGLPFALNVALTVLVVWLFTFRGGVKSIIWTDVLKSLCLILSVVLCIVFISNRLDLGIADITGAYIAGIVLCSLEDASYIERRVDISSYTLFAPVFFASIGLKTDISGLTPTILLFSVCFVAVALLTKIIGCGLAAKLCRFNWGDSLKVGVGMMTRGEVALIVAQKGLGVGVVDSVYFTAVILLIVVSSIVTPLALKGLFAKG